MSRCLSTNATLSSQMESCIKFETLEKQDWLITGSAIVCKVSNECISNIVVVIG